MRMWNVPLTCATTSYTSRQPTTMMMMTEMTLALKTPMCLSAIEIEKEESCTKRKVAPGIPIVESADAAAIKAPHPFDEARTRILRRGYNPKKSRRLSKRWRRIWVAYPNMNPTIMNLVLRIPIPKPTKPVDAINTMQVIEERSEWPT